MEGGIADDSDEEEENFELSKAHALPSYLLQAQTPMSDRSAGNISALYNTTLDANDSAVDAFNWTKEVFNPEMNLDLTKKVVFQTPSNQPLPPKIAIKAPSSDVSGNDSFFKGVDRQFVILCKNPLTIFGLILWQQY